MLLDYLSIIGDQSDNITGLNGVGPKTAVNIEGSWMKLLPMPLNVTKFGVIYENRDLLGNEN